MTSFIQKNWKKFKKKLKKLSKRRIASYFLVIITAYALFSYISLPNCKELKNKSPDKSKLMEVRTEEACAEGKAFHISRKWVGIENIPFDVIRAVVTSEDYNFFYHPGFDLGEIWHVIKSSVTQLKAPRGASTISQQLAKNMYLADSWTITRKFKEIIVTRRLEKELGKKRIIELYLNYIEWGNGVFGIEAASKLYFKKSAANLSRSEAVFLAAIIPRPLLNNNPENPDSAIQRKIDSISRKMNNVRIEEY